MFRQKQSSLAWQVADDEQTWQQLIAQDNRAATADGVHEQINQHGQRKQSSNTRRRILSAVVVAVALISLLGAYLHRQARTGLAQVESELETTVETEGWAASNHSQAVLKEMLDPAAPTAWRSRILWQHEQIDVRNDGGLPLQDVRPLLFRDGVALVEVRELWDAGPAYVSHRFYRETENGWVRTAPRATLWGSLRRHETHFFRFHFRQRDTAAVEAVAAGIDDFYTSLLKELGLPAPDDAEKRSVHVTVSEAPQFEMLRAQFVRDSLEIPSPQLLPVLENATPAMALGQIIHQALVQDLFQERQDRFPTRRTWYLLLEGVRIWQLQQANHSTAGHADNLRWLYTEWPAIRRGDRALYADEADWLCQVSSGGTPVVANRLLPDSCGDEDPVQLLQKMPLPPRHLQDVEMDSGIPTAQEHWVRQWQRRAVLASVVAYGVETYGRESLSLLLNAMAGYDDWTTLIPAVYGVSLEEFENGWLAYLMT